MLSTELALNEMAIRGQLIEELIRTERPDLLNLFFTYQNEARASRELLENSLSGLGVDAEILEVGGGILALAIQLASEGFKVTTVEPIGGGFAGISYIMELYSELAKNENISFDLLQSPIEVCEFDGKFDFIFAINVMEHLADPYLVLNQMIKILKDTGRYRFVCPNYNFPYEPHFAKWLWRRRGKSFILEPSRANSLRLSLNEQRSLFNSLNFITLQKVVVFAELNQIQLQVNKHAFSNLLSRALKDSVLMGRHARLVFFLKLIAVIKLNKLAIFLPALYQPVMDLEASSRGNPSSRSHE